MSMLDAIIELRGGLPEKCDFCGESYNEHRHPTPDEGGEWACTECWARWDKEEAAIRARGTTMTWPFPTQLPPNRPIPPMPFNPDNFEESPL